MKRRSLAIIFLLSILSPAICKTYAWQYCKVDITSADITQDKIHVNLTPSGLSGTLKLELIGPESSHTIREVTRASGSYDETFDIPNLAVGEYTKVKATWTVGSTSSSDEYFEHIRVLGNYKHTCYNTVDECGCAGSKQWFSYTIGDCVNTNCVWSNKQGKSDWFNCITNPAYGTGSGRDESGNIYVIEWFCTGNPYSPKLRLTGCPCPYCGGSLSVGDVAINPNHSYLACGCSVLVYEHGVHTVRDHGEGLVEKQLDHYYGISGCGVCPSLGDNIMTILLLP
ncbi:MAG: hypothetical protein Q7J55_03035 [bacterium]|nr:hypothetical protein [bacterium]